MVLLTVLEVKLNVVTSNIRGHGDDRCTVELTNKVASRYTIQMRHNDIHQNEIVFLPILDFVHSL